MTTGDHSSDSKRRELTTAQDKSVKLFERNTIQVWRIRGRRLILYGAFLQGAVSLLELCDSRFEALPVCDVPAGEHVLIGAVDLVGADGSEPVFEIDVGKVAERGQLYGPGANLLCSLANAEREKALVVEGLERSVMIETAGEGP